MNHSCMAVTHVKDMLLTCDDGSKRKYPVTFTTECKCQPTSNQASRYPFLTWIWLIKMIRNHLASTWIMKMTHKPISSFNFHLSWNILVQNKTWLYHINYIPYHYLVTFDHYWSFFYCESPMSETQNKSETKVWPLLNNFLLVAFNKTDISTCIKIVLFCKFYVEYDSYCMNHSQKESLQKLGNNAYDIPLQEKIFICFFRGSKASLTFSSSLTVRLQRNTGYHSLKYEAFSFCFYFRIFKWFQFKLLARGFGVWFA